MYQTASVTVVPTTSRPRAEGIRNPTGARIRARTGGVPSAPIEIEDQTQVKKTSKKAATDTILDRIENEIDQQGKCIEDLSRKLRFHLEQVCEDIRMVFFPDQMHLKCRLAKPLFISETRGISLG